jgi:hypothetical protein
MEVKNVDEIFNIKNLENIQVLKHFPSLIGQDSYGGQHYVGIYFMVIYKCGGKVGSKK